MAGTIIIGSQEFKGTQITGTSKDPKKFSGLSDYYHGYRVYYEVGDVYTNTTTGHVYKCTKRAAHNKDSEWKYVRTEVKSHPGKIATVSISKSNDTSGTFTAKIKVLKEAFDSTSNTRCSDAYAHLLLKCGKLSVRTEKRHRVDDDETAKVRITAETTQKSWSVTGGMTISKSGGGWTIGTERRTRMDYYPMTMTTIESVTAVITGENSKGQATGNKSSTYKFAKPIKPTISAITHDANTGRLSCVITSDEGKDEHERYDTECQWKLDTYKNGILTHNVGTFTTKAKSYTYTKDITGRSSLGPDDYVVLSIRARTRGIAGPSDWTSYVVKAVSFPAKPVLGEDVVSFTESGVDRFKMAVKLPNNGNHPTTNVKLQVLYDVTYDKAGQIPANANWQDSGLEDNGKCAAFVIGSEGIVPSPGKRTWVRLKTWNDVEAIFYRYSNYKRLEELESEAPTAANDKMSICSYTVIEDGTAAKVEIGWDKDGTDDSTSSEISWSKRQEAWRSTEQPETFDVPDAWNKGASSTGTYRKSAYVTITGLDPEETYYVKARRVLEDEEGNVTYGPYSVVKSVRTATIPSEVIANIPNLLIYGKPLIVSWAYEQIDQQRSWSLEHVSGNNVLVIASGNGKRSRLTLSWAALRARTTSDSLSLRVTINTASGSSSSPTTNVTVAKVPRIQLVQPTKLLDQPRVISFRGDMKQTALIVSITSMGISQDAPDGYRTQAAGDTVWSSVIAPDWSWNSNASQSQALINARNAMNSAQSDYDDAYAEYAEAESDVATAEAKVIDSSQDVSDYQRAIEYGQYALQEAQDRLDGLTPDDEAYESAYEDVQEKQGTLDVLEEMLDDAEDALTAAQSELSTAQAALAQIDLSDEIAALETAQASYAQVESEFIPTSSTDMPYVKTITLPDGLDFIDQGEYLVTAVGVNTDTGLESARVTGRFFVDWLYKAPRLPDSMDLEPNDVTDDDGYRRTYVDIHLSPSELMRQSDVYDLYRVTQDGAYLIAMNLSKDSVVRDSFAPFGDALLRYRVACRTTDGDVSWSDYDYYLLGGREVDGKSLRIDCGNRSVELTHCVASSDAYDKGFETHKHLDGSISGHWDAGVLRTGSMSAALIRGREAEDAESLRALARYEGPAFVRTSDGIAYEADVSVDGISATYGTAKVSVSLTASEVDLTEEFMGEVLS